MLAIASSLQGRDGQQCLLSRTMYVLNRLVNTSINITQVCSSPHFRSKYPMPVSGLSSESSCRTVGGTDSWCVKDFLPTQQDIVNQALC